MALKKDNIILKKRILKLEKINKTFKSDLLVYEKVFQSSKDVIFQFDEKGQILKINKSFKKLLGYNSQDFIGKNIRTLRFISKKYMSVIIKAFSKIILGIKIPSFFIKLTTKSGKKLYGDININVLKEKGKIMSVQVFIKNITKCKEIEDSIKNYELIIKNTSDFITIIDFKGNYIFMSPSHNKLGFNIKKMIGTNSLNYIFPEDKKRLLPLMFKYVKMSLSSLFKVRKKNVEEKISYRINCPNGKLVYFEATANLIKKTNAKGFNILMIAKDVTEKILIEKKMILSEKKYSNVINYARDLFYIHDLNNKLSFVSSQSKKLLGYTQKEMMIDWTKLLTKNPINNIGKKLTKKAIKTGEKQDLYLLELFKKNGKKILVEVDESPIKNDKGKVIGISGVIHDITLQKRTEKMIKLYKQGFEKSLNSQLLIKYENKKPIIINVNDSFSTFYGYTEKEALGKNPRILKSGKQKNIFYKHMWKAILDPKIGFWKGEIINKRKDGSFINVILSISTIFNKEKKPDYFLAHHIDVSNERRIQEEMEKTNKQLDLINKIIIKGTAVETVDSLVKNSLNLVLKLMNFSSGGVYLIDKNIANLICYKNLSSNFLKNISQIKINEGNYKKVFIKGKSIVTNDYEQLSKEHARITGFKSLASIPIKIRNKVIGAINVASKRKVITKLEIETLNMIGIEIGNLIVKIKTNNLLKNSEVKYRTMFNSSQDAILILDSKTLKFLSGNLATIKMFNLKDEKHFISTAFNELSPKYQPDGELSNVKAKRYIAQAMKKGFVFFDWTHQTIDGKEFLSRISLSKSNFEGKKVVQAIIRDVTLQKKNEVKIEENEIKLRNIVENAKVSIVLSNEKGDIIEYNMMSEDIFGIPIKKALKMKVWDLMSLTTKKIPLKRNFLKNAFLLGVKIGKKSGVRLSEIKVGEKLKNIEMHSSYINLNKKKFSLLITTDITEQLEIMRVKEELKAKKKVDVLRNNLILLTTHDLKQPLMPILGYSDLLRSRVTNKISKNYLEKIILSAYRMKDMINKVLNLSKIDAGQLKFNLNKNNLSKLVKEVIKYKSSFIKLKEIKVLVKLDKKVFVMFDKESMRTVLINLIDNAIKFTNKGGKIELRTYSKGKCAFVSVKDNGIGIKKSEEKYIFDKFYQSKKAKALGGSGIGLLLSKKIIESHNGELSFKTKYGKGTEFIIKLPKVNIKKREGI